MDRAARHQAAQEHHRMLLRLTGKNPTKKHQNEGIEFQKRSELKKKEGAQKTDFGLKVLSFFNYRGKKQMVTLEDVSCLVEVKFEINIYVRNNQKTHSF